MQHHCDDTSEEDKREMEKQRAIWHQATVIENSMCVAKRHDERLDALEALAHNGVRTAGKRPMQQRNSTAQQPRRQGLPRLS